MITFTNESQLTLDSKEIKHLLRPEATLRIQQDMDCQSPREGIDNLGTMYSAHRRYNLGDEQFRNAEDLKEAMSELDLCVCLPLYLYDHSGITINTTGFSCTFDSGQIGYIFVTKEKVREEFSVKRISKKLKEKITEYLINEVKIYDQYLTGEMYGYVVIDNKTGEELDSCWGFYGDDYKTNGILDSINYDKIYDITNVEYKY